MLDSLNKLTPPRTVARTSGTQAIARATALLRAIAGSPSGECGLAELSRLLGLERPTAHRILRRLVEEGMAQQNPLTRGYALGPLVWELGLRAQPPLTLHGLSSDALAGVAHGSGDTAFSVVCSGLDGVCLGRAEGSYPVKALMLEVGRRRPMGIGAGSLAMLALMPEVSATGILEANAGRIRASGESDVSVLGEVVARAREVGYVLKVPVTAPEIMSLGVAVRNAYGAPVLGLSIAALQFRVEHRLEHLVGLLRAAKADLEDRLRAGAMASASVSAARALAQNSGAGAGEGA